MALARAHTWNAGDLLTANDLNGEFNNILNNPISLISPTTGAINFNLTAHTNLVPTAITATSGSTGNVLTVSAAGNPIWAPFTPGSFTTLSSGQLLIGTSSGAAKPLAIGTTGQVLAVTSSNSDPSWRVIPPDGGLSTTVPSTGMLYHVSTAGAVIGLSVGSHGQVLTVSTNLPTWQTPAAAGGSAVLFSNGVLSTVNTWVDDFLSWEEFASTLSNTRPASAQQVYTTVGAANIVGWISTDLVGSYLIVHTTAGGNIPLGGLNAAASQGAAFPFMVQAGKRLDMSLALILTSSASITTRHGLTGSVTFGAVDPADGLYVRATGGMGSTYTWVGRQGSAEFTIDTTAVTSTSVTNVFRTVVTTSAAAVYANGVLQGTFTSSQFPSTGTAMTFAMGMTALAAKSPNAIDAWQIIQDR